jgi:uncharacterized protein (TIGR03067 family)
VATGRHCGDEGSLEMLMSPQFRTAAIAFGIVVVGLSAIPFGRFVFGFAAAQEPKAHPLPALLSGERMAEEPQESIRGTWLLQSMERDGKRLSVKPGAVQLIVTQRFCILQEQRQERAFVYKVHPDKSPMQIDLTPLLDEHAQGKSVLAIYSLTGEELRICESGSTRPTALAADPGSACTLSLYRRGSSTAFDDFKTLESRAKNYLGDYRLTEARRCVDEWLERQPANPQALFLRAQIYAQIPEDNWSSNVMSGQAAQADYARVVELDPENDAARLHLAEGLLDVSKPREALAHLHRLQQRQPKNAAVKLGMARCMILLGNLEEGANLLDRLLADQPRNGPALTERAKLAMQEGTPAAAETLLRKSLVIDPCDSVTLYVMSQCLQTQGKQDEAKKYLEAHDRTLTDQQRLRNLLKQITEANETPAIRMEAASLSLQMGRDKEGLAHLLRAVQLDPHFKPAHAALADYYQGVGKKELAEKHRAMAK